MTPPPSAPPLTDVLAVVVTYHPGPDLAANLAALRRQTEQVVVVDNGSSDFPAIEALAVGLGCRVIGNGANLGIAAALNQAVRLARDESFAWLATFDQDSLAPEGALAHLEASWREHPERDRIAVMTMSHRDRGSGGEYHQAGDVLEETPGWRSLRSTITSGAMIRREALEAVGGFDEALFIDSVDHDFYLRGRRAGWLVIEDRGVVLEHSIGKVTRHRLLFWDLGCMNHAPVRRYYITRNTLEVARRSVLSDPVWTLWSLVHFGGSTLALMIFERDRIAKLAATFQGAFDFLRQHFGPRPGAAETSNPGSRR